MDRDMGLWLEQSQATLIHEFGHIIGFPDCYVEFWDERDEAFVFYSLDPTDRMCALSGETLPRHRQALDLGFRPQPPIPGDLDLPIEGDLPVDSELPPESQSSVQ
jgi:hypothetical protein